MRSKLAIGALRSSWQYRAATKILYPFIQAQREQRMKVNFSVNYIRESNALTTQALDFFLQLIVTL